MAALCSAPYAVPTRPPRTNTTQRPDPELTPFSTEISNTNGRKFHQHKTCLHRTRLRRRPLQTKSGDWRPLFARTSELLGTIFPRTMASTVERIDDMCVSLTIYLFYHVRCEGVKGVGVGSVQIWEHSPNKYLVYLATVLLLPTSGHRPG